MAKMASLQEMIDYLQECFGLYEVYCEIDRSQWVYFTAYRMEDHEKIKVRINKCTYKPEGKLENGEWQLLTELA